MISLTGIGFLVLAVLLVILVIRVSEISTRMQIIENQSKHISTDYDTLYDRLTDYCTHAELRAILRVVPPVF